MRLKKWKEETFQIFGVEGEYKSARCKYHSKGATQDGGRVIGIGGCRRPCDDFRSTGIDLNRIDFASNVCWNARNHCKRHGGRELIILSRHCTTWNQGGGWKAGNIPGYIENNKVVLELDKVKVSHALG